MDQASIRFFRIESVVNNHKGVVWGLWTHWYHKTHKTHPNPASAVVL